MDVKVIIGDIKTLAVDAIVIGAFETRVMESPQVRDLDRALGGAIAPLAASGEIKGKAEETTLIYSLGRITPGKILIAGLGKEESFNADSARRAAAEGCKALRAAKTAKVAITLLGADSGKLSAAAIAQAIVEGSLMGLYTFSRHQKKDTDRTEIAELAILAPSAGEAAPMEEAAARGRIIAEATCLARDITNEPGNFMTPSDVASVARKVAGEGNLEIEVLEPAQIRALGMGGLMAVAQGSRQEPKFIILRHKGDPSSSKCLGLIGKGITFDSGGISIKPSEDMHEMKGDKAGAAIVIGAMSAIGRLKLEVNITAMAPCSENLPDGAAFKPGDIITALNGKTIEVLSTDAEGRLLLADALSYANKLKLSPLIDVATLTGACRIALGGVNTGAFTNNQALLDRLMLAAKDAGEKVWPMPMNEEYKEEIKSDVADVKNIGGRTGGAITAAKFLEEFAGETPWVHLDIAPTSHSEKEKGYVPKGAVGIMVRTLVNLAEMLAGEK